MSRELTKTQKRRLRDLAGLAYARELAAACEALLAKFRRWKCKEIDVFELNERIHGFRNAIASDIRQAPLRALTRGRHPRRSPEAPL